MCFPMVDYSKFDNIEDSDEEREKVQKAKAVVSRQAQAPFHPPTREPPTSQVQAGRDGRELLEPDMNRLKIVQPGGGDDEQRAMQEQMARWAAQMGGGPPEAEQQASSSKPTEPKKTCIRSDGRKKVHTTNPDGSELVEEYDERTDVLLLRRSRKAQTLGGEGEWVTEVGQVQEKVFDAHTDTLRASASNPIFLRKDTPEHFQWRIRNLTFPVDVYSVTIDDQRQQIVVRTSNKKYFKRIDVEDLKRVNLKLKEDALSWKHQHNTLIISYTRPLEVIKAEQAALKLAEKAAMV